MLNWIVWNKIVFVIEAVLTLNWIVQNRTVLTFILTCKLRTYAKLIFFDMELFWYLTVCKKIYTYTKLNWFRLKLFD